MNDLKTYFSTVKGLGVLATASSQGEVDMAVYARPHVIDDNTIAFIMADKLSHQNLQANPHAAYLFREGSDGYAGKRLHLTKLAEDTNREKVEQATRNHLPEECLPKEGERRFLVTFRVDKVRPLVGD